MFLALAIEAWEPEVFGIDYTVRTLVQAERSPALERPMRWISGLGSGYVLIPLNLALLGFFLRRGHGWALWVPILTAGSVVVEGLGKWIVHRPRPKGTHYGFPSGHVTGSVVPRRWRWFGSGLAGFAVLGIAYSRIYLNAHWFSDVLGGFTGGAAYLGFGITWIARRVHSPGGSVDAHSACAPTRRRRDQGGGASRHRLAPVHPWPGMHRF